MQFLLFWLDKEGAGMTWRPCSRAIYGNRAAYLSKWYSPFIPSASKVFSWALPTKVVGQVGSASAAEIPLSALLRLLSASHPLLRFWQRSHEEIPSNEVPMTEAFVDLSTIGYP